MDGVEFNKGMINIEELDSSIPKLLICDDMMESCSQTIAEIFTKHAHHRNLSIIFITQNLYQKSQHMRNMNLNSSYLVLFRTPRDVNQLEYLSRQMYGHKRSKFLVSAFQMAAELSSHPYLVVDLKADSDEIIRVRSNVFPSELTYIFLPSSKAIS